MKELLLTLEALSHLGDNGVESGEYVEEVVFSLLDAFRGKPIL